MIETDNYFLQPLLMARIASEMGTDIRGVLTGYDLAALLNGDPPAVIPCVYVVYVTDDIIEKSGDGEGEIIGQQWQTILAVQNVIGTNYPKAVHEEAGPLITKLRQSLAGWSPTDDYHPFRRITAPQASYLPELGLFPLAWQINLEVGDY